MRESASTSFSKIRFLSCSGEPTNPPDPARHKETGVWAEFNNLTTVGWTLDITLSVIMCVDKKSFFSIQIQVKFNESRTFSSKKRTYLYTNTSSHMFSIICQKEQSTLTGTETEENIWRMNSRHILHHRKNPKGMG